MFHCTTYQPSYFLNLQRLLSFFSTKTTLQLGLHTRGRKKEQVQKKKLIIESEKESERVSAIQSKKK
jgi:hypothetical protein